jgi:hypothetical protein
MVRAISSFNTFSFTATHPVLRICGATEGTKGAQVVNSVLPALPQFTEAVPSLEGELCASNDPRSAKAASVEEGVRFPSNTLPQRRISSSFQFMSEGHGESPGRDRFPGLRGELWSPRLAHSFLRGPKGIAGNAGTSFAAEPVTGANSLSLAPDDEGGAPIGGPFGPSVFTCRKYQKAMRYMRNFVGDLLPVRISPMYVGF